MGVYDCGVVSWLLCLIVDLLAGFGEFRLGVLVWLPRGGWAPCLLGFPWAIIWLGIVGLGFCLVFCVLFGYLDVYLVVIWLCWV